MVITTKYINMTNPIPHRRREMMRQRTADVEFTKQELNYLSDRSLGRLAFICHDKEAHITPVLFEFDGAYFYLSGGNLRDSDRFQNLPAERKVTLLVDDVDAQTNWVPRGIEVTGNMEMREKGDYSYVRIRPLTKTSWGL